MDKKKFILSLIGIWLVFSTVSLFAQLPEWAKTGKSPKHQDEFYWVAVSSASGPGGMETAKQKCAAEIASQLKVTVSSKISMVQTETIVGKDATLTSEMRNEAQTIVENMQLTGLQYVETYLNPVDNTSWVLAVLDKQQFFKGLLSEIEQTVEQFRQRLENSKKLVASGDLGEAVNTFTLLMGDIPSIYPKIVFYNSLSPVTYSLPPELVYENVEFEFTKLLGNVNLTIVSGNNQTGEIGKLLPEPFVVKVIYKDGDKVIPLKGLTVTFKNGKNDRETALTNAEGIASIRIAVSPDAVKGGKYGEIIACINLKRLTARLRSKVEENTSEKFDVTIMVTALAVGIEVTGIGSKTSQFELSKKIVRELEKNGANVNQTDSRFLLRGVISATEGQSVQGMGGTLFTQNIELSLILIEKQTDDVIGTVLSSAKGVDKDKTKAIEKGIGSLSISTKEMAELLAKAKDRVKQK